MTKTPKILSLSGMRVLSFLVFCSLFACSNSALEAALKTTKDALASAKTDLQKANQEIATLKQADTGKLVHVVFFKVKPNADVSAVIAAIKKVQQIPIVQDLEVGTFEDLGDDRALSDYNLVMEMTFDNKAAYEKYQQHPIHLGLKESIGPFLAGPPATYDFIER